MRAQRHNATRNLVFVVGLGFILTAALLWWASERALDVRAYAELGQGSLTRSIAAIRYGDVSPAWDSTEPVTTEIVDWHVRHIWPIPRYGVTVTFPGASISGEAVLTFTPELSDELPPPSLATPYYFDIRGVYKATGLPVSPLKFILFDVEYDESELGSVSENTLHVYWSYSGQDDWKDLRYKTGRSWSVDPNNNLFHFEDKSPGHYGIGGYGSRSFFPLVARLVTMASSGLDSGGGQRGFR